MGAHGFSPLSGNVTPVSALSLGGGAFSIGGLPKRRDAAILDINLGLKVGPQAIISASFGGLFAQGNFDKSAKADLSIKF